MGRKNDREKVSIHFEFETGTDAHVQNAFAHLLRLSTKKGPSCMTPIPEDEGTSPSNLPLLDPTFNREVTETKSVHRYTINRIMYLNQYQLGKELGKGSFGEVMYAFDVHEERKVAIKVMK